jgi:hypothetical protein
MNCVWKCASVQWFPDILKRIALFETSQASPAYLSDKSIAELKMSMERWWSDADRGKPEAHEEKPVP